MIAPLALLSLFVPYVAAWGVAGHQAIATIAQVHLFPSTLEAIQPLLPPYAHGYLAPIAAWADRIRMGPYRWSGKLHYVTPLDDSPPSSCGFAGTWRDDANVLSAVANYTERLYSGDTQEDRNVSLAFLVHFIGDAHQPLHLTGRERGGNGDPVLFEGRHMSLHGLWDTGLITKAIRELHNYTRPLPSRQIESALHGSIYDPYVRFILWEGVRKRKWGPLWHSGCSLKLCMTWAGPTHLFDCSHVFPPDYDPQEKPLRELNTPAYYGRIRGDKVIEKLLAKAGLRLAAVLNDIFASEEDKNMGMIANWMEVVDGKRPFLIPDLV